MKKIYPWETEEYRNLLYTTPYEDDGSNIDGFMRFVRGTHNSFVGGKLISPYFAIVQSSGTGKTRLAIEVAKKELVLSLYILCLESQGCEPSPFMQALKAHFLGLVRDRDVNMVDALADWMVKRLWNAIAKLSNQSAAERLYMSGMYVLPADKQKQDAFWSDVLSKEGLPSKGRISISCPVVIVFDEARGLTNMVNILVTEGDTSLKQFERKLLFHATRRALSSLSGYLEVITFSGVMLDTNSRVANFLPQPKDDPSSRLISADSVNEGKDLFVPHLYISSFDATLSQIGGVNGLISSRKSDSQSRVDLLTLGRPLWRATSQAIVRNPFDMETTLLNAAIKKLGQDKVRSEEDSLLVKLVPILCRLSLRLNGATTLTSSLVTHFLAILFYCSKDRDYLRVTYREEPVLGAAMASLLSRYKTNSVAKYALMALREYLLLHGGEVGYHGEFSTQLLLSASIDNATKGKPHHSCYLEDLMISLVGRSVTVPIGFARARIAFVQFVKTQSLHIGSDLLERAVKFSYAIAGHHQNKGYDLLIPMEMPDGKVGCFLVEIRNWATGKSDTKGLWGGG